MMAAMRPVRTGVTKKPVINPQPSMVSALTVMLGWLAATPLTTGINGGGGTGAEAYCPHQSLASVVVHSTELCPLTKLDTAGAPKRQSPLLASDANTSQ